MLFKILQGPSSRIGTDTTPLHEGYAYFAPDSNGFYIDAKVNDVLQRIQINPDEVLWATPDVTTYDALKNAHDGKQLVALWQDGSLYLLSAIDTATQSATLAAFDVSGAIVHAYKVTKNESGATTWTSEDTELVTEVEMSALASALSVI